MIKRSNNYDDKLKLSGLKNTKSRTSILEILQQSDQPIAAEEVYSILRRGDISINLSTVYRALEVLAEKNVVTKLSIVGDNRTLFEYNKMVHRHYLVCLKCRKILAIDHCPLESYEKDIERETNFTIAGHKLDIYGYCPECKSQGTSEKSIDS